MNSTVSTRHDAGPLSQMRANPDTPASGLHGTLAVLEHRQRIFEKAARQARIGIFECTLSDERLEWSDVVYDLFDLPHGTRPDRSLCIDCYTSESAAELQRRRDRAIREHGGFSFDAEIVTPKGNHRWIRIAAQVECEASAAVRLFGTKQDITEEKILFERTRHVAECDIMTNLANRRRFHRELFRTDAADPAWRSPGTLLLVDLDGFKAINHAHGHAAGDACLSEVARRLEAVCGDAALIARIGGDEFAVIFGPETDRAAAVAVARQVIEQIANPIGREKIRIGASVGIAFGADCRGPQDFHTSADNALHAAKRAGINGLRIFDPAHPLR